MAPLAPDSNDNTNSSTLASESLQKSPLHENEDSRREVDLPARRRVSFGALVASHEHLSRKDYTPQERKASWMDRKDLLQSRDRARSQARLIQRGCPVPTDFSTRGLEHRTIRGAKQKRQARANAYTAVWLELDYQHQHGFCDDEMIADAYFVYSEPCAALAQMVGVRDEREARKIYQEEPPATDDHRSSSPVMDKTNRPFDEVSLDSISLDSLSLTQEEGPSQQQQQPSLTKSPTVRFGKKTANQNEWIEFHPTPQSQLPTAPTPEWLLPSSTKGDSAVVESSPIVNEELKLPPPPSPPPPPLSPTTVGFGKRQEGASNGWIVDPMDFAKFHPSQQPSTACILPSSMSMCSLLRVVDSVHALPA